MTDPIAPSVRLAIVGSTQFAEDDAAAARAAVVIEQAIKRYKPIQIVSGGAVGIDSMARAAARVYGIDLQEHFPKNRRWKPDGFADRNLLIAQDCTRLLAIRHPDSTTYGSGWTADRAEEMGKPVERITVGPVPSDSDVLGDYSLRTSDPLRAEAAGQDAKRDR